MFVGILTQLGLQTLSQVAPQDLVEVLEQRLAGPDQEGQHAEHQDLLAGRGEP